MRSKHGSLQDNAKHKKKHKREQVEEECFVPLAGPGRLAQRCAGLELPKCFTTWGGPPTLDTRTLALQPLPATPSVAHSARNQRSRLRKFACRLPCDDPTPGFDPELGRFSPFRFGRTSLHPS